MWACGVFAARCGFYPQVRQGWPGKRSVLNLVLWITRLAWRDKAGLVWSSGCWVWPGGEVAWIRRCGGGDIHKGLWVTAES
ncbi:hypothetical protein D3C71_1866070 [compost metagenome]